MTMFGARKQRLPGKEQAYQESAIHAKTWGRGRFQRKEDVISRPVAFQHKAHIEYTPSGYTGHGIEDHVSDALCADLTNIPAQPTKKKITEPADWERSLEDSALNDTIMGNMENLSLADPSKANTKQRPYAPVMPASSLLPPPDRSRRHNGAGEAQPKTNLLGNSSVLMNSTKVQSWVSSLDESFQSARDSLDAEMARMSVPPVNPTYIADNPYKYYRKGKKLGGGGYGDVYEGTDRNNAKRQVALKEISTRKVPRSRIEAEVRVMCCDRHPNMVKCYETYIWKDYYIVAMELASAGNLTGFVQYLDKCQRRMPEPQIAFLMRECFRGLHYMHKSHRLHRDIKSDNVLIFYEDASVKIKLADFGLVKDMDAVRARDRMSTAGTKYWMAPEVQDPDVYSYSYEADMWSMGIMALELAQWNPPHIRLLKTERVRDAVLKSKAPRLDKSHPWSAEFQHFVHSMLQKEPSHRMSLDEAMVHPFLQKACSRDEMFLFLVELSEEKRRRGM